MTRPRRLMLVRGLPGSGKTTFAKQYANSGWAHCEADHFFEVSGEYRFNPKMLKDAHEFCINKAAQSMMNGKNVVVSNTFTTRSEMEPYIAIAKQNGYAIEEITMRGEYRSIHNVPDSAIERMRARWED